MVDECYCDINAYSLPHLLAIKGRGLDNNLVSCECEEDCTCDCEVCDCEPYEVNPVIDLWYSDNET